MGQQQLLLLVLGAIIVGVAIVVGMNMFSGSALQANQDAVRQDLLNMTSRAMEWYRKPTVLGGGGKSFADIDFKKIGYSTTLSSTGGIPLEDDDVTMTNENGTYTISTHTADNLIIEGICAEDTDITYEAEVDASSGKIEFVGITKSGT